MFPMSKLKEDNLWALWEPYKCGNLELFLSSSGEQHFNSVLICLKLQFTVTVRSPNEFHLRSPKILNPLDTTVFWNTLQSVTSDFSKSKKVPQILLSSSLGSLPKPKQTLRWSNKMKIFKVKTQFTLTSKMDWVTLLNEISATLNIAPLRSSKNQIHNQV